MHGSRVPGDGDAFRPVVDEQLEEHVDEPEQRVGREALRRRELLGEREVRPVGEVVAVDEEQLGVAGRAVVELELLPGEGLRHGSESTANASTRPRSSGDRVELEATMPGRAEVAELGDALDSKSSGALPRAGSIPAFGIGLAASWRALPRRADTAKPGVAMTKSVGVLTGGGDCPGLNAVIRAVTKRLLGRGYEIVGIRDGWQGLIEGRFQPLGARQVSGILSRGGTILGTTGVDPGRVEGGVERALEQARPLAGIVAIGGEGTLGVAARLHADHGLPVVGVPKTIDNDLAIPT